MNSVFALPLLTVIVHVTTPAAGPPAEPPATGAPANAAAEALDALLREYDAWRFHEFPELARARGAATREDAITEVGLAAEGRRRGQLAVFVEDLGAIDASALGDADRLDRELLRIDLQQAIDRYDRGLWLLAVGPQHGPQHSIGHIAEGMRFDSDADCENYLKRLSWVPQNLANVIEILREGIRRGLVPSKASVAAVPAQFDEALANGVPALREPLMRCPASVSEARRAEFLQEFDERLLPPIRTALQDLAAMVRSEYLSACRDTDGLRELPNGNDLYRFELAAATTAALSPEEIHAIGEREVTRIRAELLDAIRGTEWFRASAERAALAPSALIASYRADPRFRPAIGEALVGEYRALCVRAEAAMPALFGQRPLRPVAVRAAAPYLTLAQPATRYEAGSPATGDPGLLVVNIASLDRSPRCEAVANALRDAIPGRHLQSAVAGEVAHLRPFRRDRECAAFVEGWADYAERLGIEMGMYATADDEAGRLLMSLRHACAMVADTGINVLGWTRDRAIASFRENVGLAEEEARLEVERVLAWPGRACAGPLGAMRILELRATAERTLGERFRVRDFHDVVLGGGAMPLPQLEERVRRWTDAERAKGAAAGEPR